MTKEKNEIGKKIKNAREYKGYTQTGLGELLGNKKNTVSNWENGASLPTADVLGRLCTVLGISADELLGLPVRNDRVVDSSEKQLIRSYRKLDRFGKRHVENLIAVELERNAGEDDARRRGIIRIKVFEQSASAGFGNYLSEGNDASAYELLDVYDSEETRRCDFAVRVNGDSMEPEYSSGDLLLIDTRNVPLPGQIGVFILNGESYVKQFGKDRLISLNKNYRDILFGEEDSLKCVGAVKGKISPASLPI